MSTLLNAVSVRPAEEQIQRYIPAGLYVLALVAFLSCWHWKTTGHLSGSVVGTFSAFSVSALIYGGFVLRGSPLPSKLAVMLTLQFLFGFLFFNTCLLVLSLAFDWGIAICFLILAALAPLTLFVRGGRPRTDSHATRGVLDLLCLVISGVGATLWCADALNPIVIDGQNTVFKLWQDSFYHMRLISTFSQAHGLGSVSDLRMVGAPPFVYHYASYFMPAAVERLTGASALEVFAGFQLPFGILLTGLAAFALAASLWGPWPGLAASCAIILLPDAYLQGFSNRYLSYDFLQQVNLAGLYGVSCAAAAWIFILHGCRSGKYASIIIGYGLILLTAAYKSQIFVANAFLAMIYPCLFFTQLRASRRWVVATALLLLFGVALWLAQNVQGVPTLRLDYTFRSGNEYARQVLGNYDPGFFKSLFRWLMHPDRPNIIIGLSAAAMILLCSFGLWIGAFSVVFIRLSKRIAPSILFFPLLLIVNYLVMALGLSSNTAASLGGHDVLKFVPAVWAYFGVVSWTSGAAYALAFGNDLPRGRSVRASVIALALLVFIIPWRFAPDLQTFPAWPGFASFAEFGGFPSCLVRAAQYIREHSQSGDVVQDSANDRNMLVGALAERPEFAVDFMFGERSAALKARLDELDGFKESTSGADLLASAGKDKIAWYLLRPETKLSWPKSFQRNFSFDCEGYRVYSFPISSF